MPGGGLAAGFNAGLTAKRHRSIIGVQSDEMVGIREV
jgi:hypothetical protein